MTHELLDAETITAEAESLINPQKARADKALEAIRKRVSAIHSEMPEELTPIDSGRILRGDERFDPKTFAQAVARIRERQPYQDELDRLSRLAIEIRQERRHRQGSESIGAAYDFMRAQLDALVAAVRNLGDVPATAEQALSSKSASDAWREGQALVAAYEAIRKAQIAAWRAVGDWAPDMMPLFRETQTADAYRVDAVWISRWSNARSNRAQATDINDFINALPTPKFNAIELGPGPFPDGADRLAYLRWIATECEPWVLTPDQARDTHRQWKNDVAAATPPARQDADTRMLNAGRAVERMLRG